MSKTVFITGGSSGIGKAIGEYLLLNNFIVFGTSRNPKKYPNSKFTLLKLDINDLNSIKHFTNNIKNKKLRIDILINNAGVGITGPMEEIPILEMKKNFETNFFGPINLINSVLPIMRNQKKGLIINITSIAGYIGLPFRGIYSAGKGALELITESYRIELKQFGIKMTNIAPGDFSTRIAESRYHSPVSEDSPYKINYKSTLHLLNQHVNKGKNPLILGKLVHRIIKSNNPKIHYKIGAPVQKFSIILKRVLPDLIFEKMLMLFYKL